MSLAKAKEKIKLETKYFPLSFINTKEEVLKQIKNTLIFSYLLHKYDETTLQNYLVSTQYGYTTSALEKGNHKLVRITDINNGTVEWENVPFCDCDSAEKYLLKENDILIARTGGTTGKSFLVKDVPVNAVFASYLIRLRLKDDVEFEFINNFLNSYVFWSQIVEMKSGSAMPNVNAEKLKTLRLPKCDNKIQKEILKLLDNENYLFPELNSKIKIGELIFKNSNKTSIELSFQLNLIKQLRQAFLKEAMQGLLVKTEAQANQETGKALLETIKAEKAKLIAEGKLKKEKPLPPISEKEIPFEIPENWFWCRLGEVCSKIGSGSTPKGSNYANNGIPFFRSQNIHDNGLVYDDIKFISDEIQLQMKGTKVIANDILLNITGGSMGRVAIVPIDFEEGNVSQHVCIIRPIKISNDFIHKLILSPYFQKLIFSSTTGAGREGLPKYNLEQFLIPLPPIHEQNQIVKKLDELMLFCDGLEASIKESKGLNEKLLQDVLGEVLSGEVLEN